MLNITLRLCHIDGPLLATMRSRDAPSGGRGIRRSWIPPKQRLSDRCTCWMQLRYSLYRFKPVEHMATHRSVGVPIIRDQKVRLKKRVRDVSSILVFVPRGQPARESDPNARSAVGAMAQAHCHNAAYALFSKDRKIAIQVSSHRRLLTSRHILCC